jgi:nucleoside-diphosphate-sugar epimerase
LLTFVKVYASYAIKHQDMVAVYNVSKKLAEQAAWKFMEDHEPIFDLTVINPDIIIGPMIQPILNPSSVNETNRFAVYNFFDGTYKQIEGLKFPFYHFVCILSQIRQHINDCQLTLHSQVDVRDVARAHVLALSKAEASNKRIILVSSLITPQLIINIIYENFPELRSRLLKGKPDQIFPEGVAPTGWNTSRSFEIFGPGWSYINLEKSVVDAVHSIIELEKTWSQNI